MESHNRIQISASMERLFPLAANIAHWPEILPHYRWVKVLEQHDGQVIAEMAARHRGVPLWWKTIQQPLPQERRIRFTHIGGITRGMEVEWTFEQVSPPGACDTWLVQIHHDFQPRWPAPGPWVADRIIGRLFVQQVADKTLRRIKEIAESNSAVIASELSSIFQKKGERGNLRPL